MSAQRLPLLAPALDDERRALLARLVDGLDPGALWWLSGYTAALAQSQAGARPVAAPVEQARLSIVYGSQTGNARREAEALAREAEAGGLAVRLLRADAYPLRELASERLLYVVISTQGDGDPPDDARAFLEHLAGKRAPKLPELKYAVLGLGDSSYPQFCEIGRRLDARLAELGATRLQAAAEADVDIESVATPWRAKALEHARDLLRTPSAPLATVTPLRPGTVAAPSSFGRERPFEAELLGNQRITARESRKDVRHIELALEGSGFAYEPGDSLGIWHRAPDALIEPVLQATGLEAASEVDIDGQRRSLHDWLATRREVTRLSRPFLAALAERSGSAELSALLAPEQREALAALLADHQTIDVLRRWPADWDATEFVRALRPLTPRLYSIASSRKAVGEEAHLTVDVLRYDAFGHAHGGAASGFLAALDEGSAPVYVEPNERFRLPADASRDVIMIGPGTGVAPFRAFLQERTAVGAAGRNWLFFGNPHFRSDFLYQVEWQQALRDGRLQRLDLAFSRDAFGLVTSDGSVAPRRTYVQQRIAERASELYAWIENGAHLYVCGATAMGRDVHAALRDVLATQGGIDTEAAEERLAALQRDGRYARDVY